MIVDKYCYISTEFETKIEVVKMKDLYCSITIRPTFEIGLHILSPLG